MLNRVKGNNMLEFMAMIGTVALLIVPIYLISLAVSNFEQQEEDATVKLQVDMGYMKSRLELQGASIASLNLEVDKLRGKVGKIKKNDKKKKGR